MVYVDVRMRNYKLYIHINPKVCQLSEFCPITMFFWRSTLLEIYQIQHVLIAQQISVDFVSVLPPNEVNGLFLLCDAAVLNFGLRNAKDVPTLWFMCKLCCNFKTLLTKIVPWTPLTVRFASCQCKHTKQYMYVW